MIKQIGLPLRGRPILLITRLITDRIGLHSVLLPFNRSDFPYKFVLAKILLYYFLFHRIEEELGANAKFAGEKFRRPLE